MTSIKSTKHYLSNGSYNSKYRLVIKCLDEGDISEYISLMMTFGSLQTATWCANYINQHQHVAGIPCKVTGIIRIGDGSYTKPIVQFED